MKTKLIQALAALAFLAAALSCRQHAAECKIEFIGYRGWDSCVRMSNGILSVIINPTYGGQVIHFGFESDGENVLWADTVINGWTVQDYTRTRRSPAAGRFDTGPERATEHIHDTIWAGPYTVDISGALEVSLRSLPSRLMGISMERVYTLDPDSAKFTVKQTMTNISDRDVRYCFWTRTLLPAGGIYRCSYTPTARYPAGYSPISLSTDLLIPVAPDPRVYASGGVFEAVPGGGEIKYGIFTTDGSCSYTLNGTTYIKKNRYVEGGAYDNNGGVGFPNMIYFNDTFIELEPNSPVETISPGGKYEYTETWELTGEI